MSDTSASLSIKQLTKTYDGAVAVECVDLDVGSGELLTLLGPSGSGKTTLLMSIAGFTEPETGQIILNGRDITTLPPHRRGIGVVFQQYALFPHLSIEENVAYPLAVRGVSRARRQSAVAGALKLVQLESYASRRPGQLSGGQQQRVALARALVFKPPVLLMDEPLGALDRKLRAEMQLEIRTIQRSLRITTVYVTHDQEEALAISDRIAIMHRGRLEQIDSPERVYRRPASAFVADFIGDSNLFSGCLESPSNGIAQFRTAHGLAFVVACPPGTKSDTSYIAVVRPESIACSNVASASCPHSGTVKQLVYMGSTARLQIARADSTIVLATINSSAIPDIPGTGENVWFGWRPEDAVLVPSS